MEKEFKKFEVKIIVVETHVYKKNIMAENAEDALKEAGEKYTGYTQSRDMGEYNSMVHAKQTISVEEVNS